MTTQSEILEIAQRRAPENPALQTLLTSIQEARGVCKINAEICRGRLGIFDAALDDGRPDYSVCLDNSDFVGMAAALSAGLTRMASDFANLATILQSMGEEIQY